MVELTSVGFQRWLEGVAAQANPKAIAMVGSVTALVHGEVYKTFGDKQLLAELAPATISRREYLITQMPAIGGTDSPLLFTGKLRSELKMAHLGLVGVVGSEDPIALWQEIGTAHLPPRPVIRIGAQRALPDLGIVVRYYAADMVAIRSRGHYRIDADRANIVNMYTGALKG